MSEQQSRIEQGGERLLAPQSIEHKGALENKSETLSPEETQHGKHEDLSARREVVKELAVSGEEFSQGESKNSVSQHAGLIRKDLRDIQFTRTLVSVRKKLPLLSRNFSKIIHNSAVDTTSEVLGRTIARPAGLLWGSILAFVGTSALLWATRQYGYEYNYLVILLLFAGGLLLGNIGELAWKVIKKR